jgi:hypothetical protein
MTEDDDRRDDGRESFEDAVRSIAREVSRSIERVTEVDLDEVADVIGVDADRARELVDGALDWLRARAGGVADDRPGPRPGPRHDSAGDDLLPGGGGPHPLDLPTQEQGMALAALDSGRWAVEQGSHALVTDGEDAGRTDAVGIVDELRARDWVAADGEVTLAGRHALSRWLDAAGAR